MSAGEPRRRAAWLVVLLAAAVLTATVAGLLPRLAAEVVDDPSPARAAPVVAEPGRTAAPNPPERAPRRGTVYLTFDDGPDPTWTPRVLEVLRRHGAHAVFFQVGRNVAAYPDLVRQVRAEGHLVGNHSWSHARLTGLRARAVRLQLDRTDAALGGRVRCVRPPYGATDARVAGLVEARGQRTVLWDVDPQDWARPGADRLVRRILREVHDGARILLHDGGGDRRQTVAALDLVLTRLTARGYAFGLLDC